MPSYRVALINPRDKIASSNYYATAGNLGLAYLAAYLRQDDNIEVKIFDGDVERLDDDQIIHKVLSYEPDLVGATGLIRTIESALEIVKEIHNRSNPFICVGGQHATYAAEEILLNHPSVNCVVRGEGEVTLLEIIKRLSHEQEIKDILGIYYIDKGNVVKNPDRPAIDDLDNLPFPARDSLDKCIEMGIEHPVISILTSRGCPGGCSFCNSSTFFSLGGGPHWRSRSPQNVVDEIQYLVDKYKMENIYWVFHIYDDNFIGSGLKGKQRAREIAAEMIRRSLKVPFDIFCRVDSFVGDEGLIKILKQAGLVSAFIGLESGIPDTLKLYNKGTTPEQNIAAISLMEQFNIATSASGFIMFQPYATFNELRSNARFLLSIRQASFWNLSVSLILFRGTKLVEKVSKDNLLGKLIHKWAAYDYQFQVPAIGKLAKSMDFNDAPVMIKLDSTIRYIENMMYRFKDQLSCLSDELTLSDELGQSQQNIKDQLEYIQEKTVTFFLSAVDMAEENRMHDFGEMKSKYLFEINEEIDILNNQFEMYVNKIENLEGRNYE
jgi:radical SAM superfamily enzyme YgiQ (UPF0313 family)